MEEFIRFIAQIMANQKVFQEIREDLYIDQIDEQQRNALAHEFLNRANGEIHELLRTQPEGVLGQKNPKRLNRKEMLAELADVHLFLMNFMLIRNITWEDLLNTILEVQTNNFQKALERNKQQQKEKENRVNEILQGK